MKVLILRILISLSLLSIILIFVPACSAKTPQTQNLVNGVITVTAGNYYNVQFTVGKGQRNAKVTGTFTASGGSGNDIIALIFDATSYTNWSNGDQASPVYNSGQTTTANINFSITQIGTYVLVFSNTFSTFSSKQVNAQVNLGWN